MNLKFWQIVFGLFSLLIAPITVVAHHAFAAEFDREQPVEISGTVTNVEWMNPHARFYVDAKNEEGEIVNWNFELGSPNGLMRQGWRRDSLKPGDQVVVSGWRARNNPLVGNTREIHLADGTRMFAASSADNN